jgi:RNA polymerase sigma-H factor
VSLAAAGDERAFAQLASRFGGIARLIADRFYARGLEREDLRQVALIALWEACKRYDSSVVPDGSFVGFAAICMRRKVISAVQDAQRKKQALLSDAADLDVDVPVRGLSPIEVLVRREELQAVLAAVGTLTELERASLIGRAVGERMLQTEARLGIAPAPDGRPKSVDNALQRARLKIRRALNDGLAA